MKVRWTGTSLRDLMTRMGHDNPRAALIYQHASAEADLAIATAINEMVEAATSADAKPAGSTKTSLDDDHEDGTGALARLGQWHGSRFRTPTGAVST